MTGKYVVIFECDEAKGVTRFGTKALLLNEPEGWVPATSGVFTGSYVGAKTFDSEMSARQFMGGWLGHPWYHRPTGKYEIVKVIPVLQEVQIGWRATQ